MEKIPNIDYSGYYPDAFPLKIDVPKGFFDIISHIEEQDNSEDIIKGIISETEKYAERIGKVIQPNLLNSDSIRSILDEKYLEFFGGEKNFSKKQIELIKKSFIGINNELKSEILPDFMINKLNWEEGWGITNVTIIDDISGLFVGFPYTLKEAIISNKKHYENLILNEEGWPEDNIRKAIKQLEKNQGLLRFHYGNTQTYIFTQYIFNVFIFYLNEIGNYEKYYIKK